MKRTGINMETVKRQNRASVLNYLNEAGPVSRKDIAVELGLTPAAVTQICAEFMTGGILVEKGIAANCNGAGRKKILLELNYDYKSVFGINIEPEKTVIALTNLGGNVHKIREIVTNKEQEPERFLQVIADNCREMQHEIGLPDEKIAGAGVGITGVVDKLRGRSLHASGIWKEEVPVAKLLSLLLDIPVVLENSMTAFALAELLYGAGRENDYLLLLRWGPDVGCAIVADRKIYEGQNGKAAEFGHFIVEKDGRPCSCGRKGCLTTVVSRPSIREQLEQIFSYENTPKLYELVRGDFRNFNEDVFRKMLSDQDDSIEEQMNQRMDFFSRAVVNSMTMLAPSCVILCGSMFKIDKLRQDVVKSCISYEPSYDDTRIRYTTLDDRESFIGPVALFVREYLEQF